MTPEEAFRLMNHREVKHRALDPGELPHSTDKEDGLEKAPVESPKWVRYTITTIAGILALCFAILLISGGYLLYNKQEVPHRIIPIEEPLVIFSKEETHDLITSNLKAFLESINTEQRLQFVSTPTLEQEALYDYYEKRGHLDFAFWKIKLIKPVTVEGLQIWMVAYLDVTKRLQYVSFIRSEDNYLLQWSSSYAYGQMPWDVFAGSQPDTPVQMRCYILRHDGVAPPGINPTMNHCYVIENSNGEFTTIAVMQNDAEGSNLLKKIPSRVRTPINVLLCYKDLPNGTRQLTIEKLLHFRWYQQSVYDIGRPLILQP